MPVSSRRKHLPGVWLVGGRIAIAILFSIGGIIRYRAKARMDLEALPTNLDHAFTQSKIQLAETK